jgi:myo-inositol-1(or 4)-monophosphatase
MIQEIVRAVRSCAAILLEAEQIDASVMAKEGHANYVTAYDKQVQAVLRERLLAILPEAVFVGEEEDVHRSVDHGYAFIVDPIDGTSNFIKQYRCSCISVGVARDGERVGGVVYNPYADELYEAEKGKGARRNGKPIHVSTDVLADSLVAFGTAPYYEELCDRSFALAREYCMKAVDVRRSGTAAMDLCQVACGRNGMFFELRLQPWDFAAGSLIVEEAGGVVVNEDGKTLDLSAPSSVFAMNAVIYEEWKKNAF